VTSDLLRRAHEHRSGAADGFTKRYKLRRLVWFETYDDAENAILRERRMKKWLRAWKLDLIAAANPTWRDLYPDICR
jgi:putative endonuclease